jgi:hypothetical protein
MATYKPLVYRTQGGASLKVVSGGSVDLSSGGSLLRAFETVSSGALAAMGVSVISSTGTSQNVYSLGAPVAGVEKFIVCNLVSVTTGTSTGAAYVTSSGASATFGGTNTSICFTTGSVNAQCAKLIGLSSTLWAVVAQTSTNIVFSAT